MSTSRGREPYFTAAMDILGADGADGLTQAALCARVHVTTGAFYYHFGSMASFVAALAAEHEKRYVALFAGIAAEPDPVRRLELLAEAAFSVLRGPEAAYRAWGSGNETVGAALVRLDALAEGIFVDAATEVLGDRPRAVMLGHMAMAIVVGMQQQGRALDGQAYTEVVQEFFRSSLGLDTEIVTMDGAPTLRLSRGSRK